MNLLLAGKSSLKMVETNLGNVISSRENNLDIIRLVAVIMVLFSHAFILSGSKEPVALFYIGSYGTLGLNIFFVISGLLITQSYLRTRNPARFIWSRALRILPALFCVVSLSAFILGPLVTTLPLNAYFTNCRTYAYLLTLTLFIGPNRLPGVFTNNSSGPAINGSLWMLKYMIGFYGFVLFLGITKILDRKRIILMIFLLCLVLHDLNVGESLYLIMFGVDDTIRLFLYFGLGMVAYHYRDLIPINTSYFAFCVLTLVIASIKNGLNESLFVFILTYMVLYLGFHKRIYISWFSKIGDFSYGVFIYSFPVQQTVVHLYGGKMDPWVNISISLVVSLLLGALSWHLCEKRFLKLKALPTAFFSKYQELNLDKA